MSESPFANLPVTDDEDVICIVVVNTTTIVLDGVTFIFDQFEGLRTELESFEPLTIDDLTSASYWLSELKRLWPREARQNAAQVQGDLKSLWLEKLEAWESALAQKAEHLLNEMP